MAQAESFTGVSGKEYFVDYEAGLVLQLQNDEATLLSPVTVVETEFQPILDYIYYLANENEKTLEGLESYAEFYENVLTLWEAEWDQYDVIRQGFLDTSMEILKSYKVVLDVLEEIQTSRSTSYKAKQKAVSTPTTFTFGIKNIISSLDYAQFEVEFTKDWLKSFLESVDDFHHELEETEVELDEIFKLHNDILENHLAYINGVYEWLEENGEDASDETLYEIATEIADRADDLTIDVKYFPSNPVEYLEYWAEVSNDYMNETLDSYNKATETLTDLATQCTILIKNFSGVLFAGAYGDYFGMYPSIIDNDGKLILPNGVAVGEKEYSVTTIDGNIFSCVQPDVTLEDITLSLPATVTKIQNEAFAIDGIISVEVPTDIVPSLQANCFTTDVYENAHLVVLSDMEDAFKTDAIWSKFQSLTSNSISKNLISDTDIHLEGSTLIISTDTSVYVYTPDGRIVYTGKDRAIKLPTKGLYFVKAGNKIVKIKY